jgi:hypothetical protein
MRAGVLMDTRHPVSAGTKSLSTILNSSIITKENDVKSEGWVKETYERAAEQVAEDLSLLRKIIFKSEKENERKRPQN